MLAENVRSSLWAVPVTLMICAIGLAAGTVALDREIGWDVEGLWWGFEAGAEGTRAVLTTVGGSVMTVAGVSFSMTIVVLQLASSQYSPRVVRSFRRDRLIQWVFGTYIATFVYTLIVLRPIASAEEGPPFTAPISVTIAITLGIVCMFLLVILIHHVAETLQVSSIVKTIEREVRETIQRVYPEMLGADRAAATESPRPSPREEGRMVCSTKSGFLARVDTKSIDTEEGAELIRIELQVGDYVLPGDVLATVWPRARRRAEDNSDLCDAFAIAPERTMQQDVRFGLRLLVDIALRALSPSLNDPTTAVHCVDVIGSLLCRLVRRRLPDPLRTTDRGLRVYAPRPSFGALTRLAFEEIVDAADRTPRVLESVAGALRAIAVRDTDRGQNAVLAALAARINRIAFQAAWDPEDVARVREAVARVLERE